METTIMENQMEKKMENEMEAGPNPHIGYSPNILGLYRDNGKENRNYYNGLYRDYRV